MITKYKLFENYNMVYFYHATKFEHLPKIKANGLTPNIDRITNWSGKLSDWSRNKVFFTDHIYKAIYYGNIINGYDDIFPILRIKLNPNTLIRDSYNDYYSTETINGDFEILIYDGDKFDYDNWMKLNTYNI